MLFVLRESLGGPGAGSMDIRPSSVSWGHSETPAGPSMGSQRGELEQGRELGLGRES